MKLKLQAKFLLMISGIILVLVGAVLTVSIVMSHSQADVDAREKLKGVTQRIHTQINLLFQEKELQLKSIATNKYLHRYLENGKGRERVTEMLRAQFDSYKRFENLLIADSKGRIVLAGGTQKAIDLDIRDFPFWEMAKKPKPFHVDQVVYKSPVTGIYVTVLAVRIENKDGRFLGLAFMPFDWLLFAKEYIGTVRYGKTGYVFMFDRRGHFIWHPDEKLLFSDQSALPFIKKGLEMKNGFIDYVWKGDKKFMQFEQVPETAWIIAAGIEADEFYAPAYRTRNLILVIGAAVMAVGLILVFLFVRSIVRPIQTITEGAMRFAVGDIELKGADRGLFDRIQARHDELGEIGTAFARLIDYQTAKVKLSEEIAQGNLNVKVSVVSTDDRLGKALEHMVQSLNTLLSQVNSSVDQVSSGAGQVSSASQTLSQGASEQAASLEEISSSINEIASQTRQNADNATEANALSQKASQNAESGNTQMNALVTAMGEINQSSDEIKKIVKVIDDIAFQTNLLALNANVEAARAGKYGKGFAVVAEEVRNLAARSTKSVKETTNMVDKSIASMARGNQLVESTASQLMTIVESAQKAADLVEEISTASREQAQGLDQVNTGLGQIDQVTQSNTASAEESASASEELAAQAQQLKGLVAKFQLAETAASIRHIPAASPVKRPERGNIRSAEVRERETVPAGANGKNRQKAPVRPADVIQLDEDFSKF